MAFQADRDREERIRRLLNLLLEEATDRASEVVNQIFHGETWRPLGAGE